MTSIRSLWERVHGQAYVPRYDGIDGIYFSSGIFIRDDGAGTITGSASATINDPATIFRHFLQLVCGESSGNFTTGASTFGSITQAKTDLDDLVTGSWAGIYRLTDPETGDDMVGRLGAQAPIAFFKSIWDGQWKAPVYPTGSPASYRYFLDPAGNSYKWKASEDMVEKSIRVGFTPVDQVVNEVHVRFGLHAPTNTYRYDAWVGPSGSDDSAGNTDATRVARAVDSRDDYNIKSALFLDCDFITSQDIGFVLRDYIFDRFRRPRLVVQFTTFQRAIGLETGMVTLIDDEMQDVCPLPWYPGVLSARSWDDMKFFVRDLSFDYSSGNFLHTVTLEEIPV